MLLSQICQWRGCHAFTANVDNSSGSLYMFANSTTNSSSSFYRLPRVEQVLRPAGTAWGTSRGLCFDEMRPQNRRAGGAVDSAKHSFGGVLYVTSILYPYTAPSDKC
jgi:hypothetical protein